MLDKLIPIPTTEKLMEDAKVQMLEMDFPISDIKSGGVFYTLLMIVFRIKIELLELLRVVLGNLFASYASDLWLDLLAANFSVRRKSPVKATGVVTLSRIDTGPTVRIAKGNIFKTAMDSTGQELRFVATTTTIFPGGDATCTVPVEAEKAGSLYNVPIGVIKNSLTHIESVETITNAADWLTREGADEETLEALRSRTKGAWADLSTLAIRQKYQNACESMEGVLLARIDDEHPRGQGTVDAIITGTAGAATETLLAAVLAELNKIKGPYDNVLVKSSETVAQAITVALQIPTALNDEGLEETTKAIISRVLNISKGRNLNELFVSDLIYLIRTGLPQLRNVKVIEPADDVVLAKDKVIVLGAVTVTIERV